LFSNEVTNTWKKGIDAFKPNRKQMAMYFGEGRIESSLIGVGNLDFRHNLQ